MIRIRLRWFGRRIDSGSGVRAALGVLLVALALVGCRNGPAVDAGPWQEPFETGDAWRLSSDAVADVGVVDGQLQIHVFSPGQVAWGASQRVLDNLQLRVEATQISGPQDNEYGVLIRMDDDRSFYAFSISGDGYARVARYDQDGWTVLGPDWTPSDAIQQGESTNVLEVTADGAQFEFSVNGQPVVQVEDAALQKGNIGLYAGAFGEGDVVIAFDNLRVDTPSVP